VPLISVIIARWFRRAVALAAANSVLMLEHAVYSVISPEGCASILWRNNEQAADAADALKLTAQDLKRLDVIDEIIPEPLGGAHRGRRKPSNESARRWKRPSIPSPASNAAPSRQSAAEIPRHGQTRPELSRHPIPCAGAWASPSLWRRLPQGRRTPCRSTSDRGTLTQGVERSPNRAMYYAMGYEKAYFAKPMIGIANGHSTITPCNAGLQPLADAAVAAVRTAGGNPQVFGTPTISDGMAMGTEGMKYSLISREVIADCIETCVQGQWMDGSGDRRLRQELAGRHDGHRRPTCPAFSVYGAPQAGALERA
jgi:hypothetical protein